MAHAPSLVASAKWEVGAIDNVIVAIVTHLATTTPPQPMFECTLELLLSLVLAWFVELILLLFVVGFLFLIDRAT